MTKMIFSVVVLKHLNGKTIIEQQCHKLTDFNWVTYDH